METKSGKLHFGQLLSALCPTCKLCPVWPQEPSVLTWSPLPPAWPPASACCLSVLHEEPWELSAGQSRCPLLLTPFRRGHTQLGLQRPCTRTPATRQHLAHRSPSPNSFCFPDTPPTYPPEFSTSFLSYSLPPFLFLDASL